MQPCFAARRPATRAARTSLLSAAQMAALDAQTSAEYGVPSRVLMEIAGRAVADVCAALVLPGAQVLVMCGSGNNGGDGLVVARLLGERGHPVQVLLFAAAARLRGDAHAAYLALHAAGRATVHPDADAAALEHAGPELVVDALLGIGLTTPVRPPLAAAIAKLNCLHQRLGCPVVSVDVPSGVHTDTGAILGDAVNATHTVGCGSAKLAHYLYPAAGRRGRLQIADIGLRPALAACTAPKAELLDAAAARRRLPRRAGDCHKGQFGHLIALAGSASTPGAAHLCLDAALRSGAGLVSWAADAATYARLPPRPEVMLRALPAPSPAAAIAMVQAATALALGPGLGQDAAAVAWLAAVLHAAPGLPTCLDADALNIVAQHPHLWQHLGAHTVLTPHPKEMARLLDGDATAATVQADRLGAARDLATRRGCVVVLKGAGTVVAAPDGHVGIVAGSAPGLATGGTGDVLCGMVGALLAQGLRPFDAAAVAAVGHLAAARRASRHTGATGMVASDVVAHLGEVWSAWRR